jgi:UDP-2-acetamido-3-amino-2,3-dideoxy-glucuronate N-acetyltransferase
VPSEHEPLAGVDETAFVHPSAVVDPGAVVAAGARVWHHCHIRGGAAVGESSQLGKNVYVDAGVTIGARCKVQNNVSVYHGVEIGDDVFVGPSAVFTNDLRPRAFDPDWTVTPTVVEPGASIGANATIVCGTTLGRACMVAAGSVVTRDVDAHALVRGNPARFAGWLCSCGHVVGRIQASPPAADTRCERCDRPWMEPQP